MSVSQSKESKAVGQSCINPNMADYGLTTDAMGKAVRGVDPHLWG